MMMNQQTLLANVNLKKYVIDNISPERFYHVLKSIEKKRKTILHFSFLWETRVTCAIVNVLSQKGKIETKRILSRSLDWFVL